MFKVYQNADDLPEVWDEIARQNIFLKKHILKTLEGLNPCSQLYHLSLEKKIILVSYKLKIDLFTFTKYLSFNIPVNIIGVPMSVAKSGYSMGDQNNVDAFSEYIKSLKGFYLILNSNDQLKLAQGNTLPSCKMEVRWDSFDKYLLNIRSHYRYRLNKAIKKFADIKVEELADNNTFDEEMYNLYLNVYHRSGEKLEKLSIGFFKNFPLTILKFTIKGEVVAFVQLVENSGELVFLLGGFKHSLNQKYDLYINMLLQIISYGIKRGVKQIDFGQTTEETKLKLGALQQPKLLYVHHSNQIINTLLRKLVGKFSYRQYQVSHRVFKEFEGEGNESPASKMP
ncbi:MAG: GNAT family N-acetyltransferase [Bacillota bacterium]|nr:GNAT family N-acetyltransferase [Bacillota bacterium]